MESGELRIPFKCSIRKGGQHEGQLIFQLAFVFEVVLKWDLIFLLKICRWRWYDIFLRGLI